MRSDKRKKIGVIGCGQWGPNHIRNFFFHPDTTVGRVCDKDKSRLKAIQTTFQHLEVTNNFHEITRAKDIDAVVVATPVSTHEEIVRDALMHGKDVLCEKPMTRTSKEAFELAKLASKKKQILMAGHVFLFNPGILKLKELMKAGEFGETYYLHAERTNLGPVREDVNAVYDLASHDISIFNFLLEGKPKVLGAVGKGYLQAGVEDVAYVSLEYPKNILAHIHVSWLDPKKVREITVVGNRKMMTWNDLRLSGPVEIYSKHVEREPYYSDYGEFHLLVKEGEILIPYVKNQEPLKVQADHFVQCILNRREPVSDGRFAADVVKTLEEIEKILAKSRA